MELLIALAREAVIAAEPGNAATYAREAADIFDRTETAMSQAHCFKVCELSLAAQDLAEGTAR